ncbi:hypothetical protein ACQW08_06650 [Gluconobacter japonicus]|uniref:hypothetical protein n=1 Tax=Gluconobacter japonicus TaxID=376620 RepID=UPI003D2D8E75
MITVLQTQPQNTVQDLGRFGYRELGVGTAGAMDGVALQVGNILLGNQHGGFEKPSGFEGSSVIPSLLR